MQALLKAFWDIALWRRDPSQLPDSATLVIVTALAYAAFSGIQSWMLFGMDALFLRTVADLAVTVLLVWLLLSVARRRYRFNQTVSAVLGTGALLSPFVILLLALKDRFATVNDEGDMTIELPLSRQDLAAMIGTRPETIARSIRALEAVLRGLQIARWEVLSTSSRKSSSGETRSRAREPPGRARNPWLRGRTCARSWRRGRECPC